MSFDIALTEPVGMTLALSMFSGFSSFNYAYGFRDGNQKGYVHFFRDCRRGIDTRLDPRRSQRIECKIEGEPEWKRTVVLGGLKISWIVARTLIPGFSSAEGVMNAIDARDSKDLAVGMVSVGVAITPFPCFSWLLGAA